MDVFKKMALELLKEDAYKKGDFTLSSGKKSQHYINCKPVTLDGTGSFYIANLMLDMVYDDSNSLGVAGLTLGADPLVSNIVMLHGARAYATDCGACHPDSPKKYAGLIVRKKPKGHGTGAWIEGPELPKGSIVTVVEDVITTGGSALFAVEKLREHGYIVNRIITLVDRQEHDRSIWKENDLQLESAFNIKDFAREH